MFNKFKKNWYAEDFSYFIRNFGVFTQSMKLIIHRSIETRMHDLQNNQSHGRENQGEDTKVADKVTKVIRIPCFF